MNCMAPDTGNMEVYAAIIPHEVCHTCIQCAPLLHL
jgi:hypothetical protein